MVLMGAAIHTHLGTFRISRPVHARDDCDTVVGLSTEFLARAAFSFSTMTSQCEQKEKTSIAAVVVTHT
jgi:hypothetical protein